MNDATSELADSRVRKTENGQFIAFWRGQVVHKLDGALRYFESDQAAQSFLARRDLVSNSMVGGRGAHQTDRAKPTGHR
jgi:hypothetical protein